MVEQVRDHESDRHGSIAIPRDIGDVKPHVRALALDEQVLGDQFVDGYRGHVSFGNPGGCDPAAWVGDPRSRHSSVLHQIFEVRGTGTQRQSRAPLPNPTPEPMRIEIVFAETSSSFSAMRLRTTAIVQMRTRHRRERCEQLNRVLACHRIARRASVRRSPLRAPPTGTPHGYAPTRPLRTSLYAALTGHAELAVHTRFTLYTMTQGYQYLTPLCHPPCPIDRQTREGRMPQHPPLRPFVRPGQSSPRPASWASSSAWMADSTIGSSAPFITWSRLYAL